MRPSTILATTTLLLVGASAPALAAYDRIGTVDIAFGNDRDIESVPPFAGPMEQLQLRAEGSTINCRAVRATFQNGRTQQVFTGTLRENRNVNIDLPGDARNVRTLRFNCGASDRRGGTIRISANIGRYQNDWRRSPDWSNFWSRMFDWGDNRNARWDTLNNVRFQDTRVQFPNVRGRGVDAIALMPIETNARCSRVSVVFANGRTADLDINRGAVMRRGQSYTLDLPGGDRNIRDLRLQCQSEGATAVTIRVLVHS